MLHSLYSSLPVEVLDQAFNITGGGDLFRLLQVNSAFSDIARRILYHTIDISLTPKFITLLHTLCGKNHYAYLIRSLEIRSLGCQPTGNFFRLLNRALKTLPNLTSLTLPEHPPALCNGCTFSLSFFSTGSRVDAALLSFLDSQPLTELCLRGRSAFTADTSLPVTTIPQLKTLRLLQSNPSFLRSVIRGRPIEFISLVMTDDFRESLEALALSTMTLKRLSALFFNCPNPSELLAVVSSIMPELEALHVVVLASSCPMAPLKTATPFLSGLRNLKYITFMTGSHPIASNEEKDVAELWQRACPSLKTIILPNGVVWFRQGEGISRCPSDV